MSSQAVAKWGVFEAELSGPKDGNPYVEVELRGWFTQGARTVDVPGFYDGEGVYRIRFMPDREGEWTMQTTSNVAALDGKAGAFVCGPARAGMHGPVRTRNTFHFAHADGTPFFPFGTTCYAWTHQPLALQEQTLASLKKTRFNKVRTMVFPKDYLFNVDEPLHLPYERDAAGNFDFNRPNFAFFQHLDRSVAALKEIGVHADLILFHGCDRWGFRDMGDDADLRYVKYLAARLASHFNVWWAAGNEYDFLLDVKPMSHWDDIFHTIVANDPYGHPKSNHNAFLDVAYDHTKPWIDHVSLQHADVKLTPEWRKRWNKPILNDEPEYEGNIHRPWGNISAAELVHRFWITVMRGGYASHGETYLHPKDILWWGKGGTLHGESWKRIGFLRDLIEEDVKNGLTPFGHADQFEGYAWTRVSGAHDGDVRYIYFGEHQPAEWAVGLPMDDGDYEISLIDTWNMTVTPMEKGPLPVSPVVRRHGAGELVDPGPEAAFGIKLPGKPYLAVRVRRRTSP